MAVDRFLIAPIATGLETDLRPFMIPDDAFAELNNAYVFRGRVRKRFGSRFMEGSTTPTDGYQQLQSRARIALTGGAGVGITDGAGNATGTVPGTIFKVGQIFSIGDEIYTVFNPAAGANAMYDTGATTTKTFNLATGVYNFVGAPINTQIYFYPAEPIMGLITYEVAAVNDEPVIAFDTQFAYQYTTAGWDRLGTALWTGNNAQFFWGYTFRGVNSYQNFLYVTNFNIPDQIKYWDGTTWTTTNPIFNAAGDTIETCRLIVPFKDRLVLLNTVEKIAGTNRSFVNRIRYSQNGDPTQTTAGKQAFREDVPGKGGYVDAPTKEAIITCQFLKDRLIVYFESSTWELVYTANEILPFRWQQINTELGAESTFSQVPFDKVVLGVGNVGIHACNGANVERIDQKIPDSVFEIHNADNGIERVNGIRDYYVQMVYWTFPGENKLSTAPYPNRVLVYNYQTGAWAFNDDSITVFGYYQPILGTTWGSDEKTWEESEETWNSGELEAQFKNVLAGNQEGFIFIVDADEPRNASVLSITNITFPAGVLTLYVRDHNLYAGDYIYIENCQGITGLNGKIYQVITGSETDVNNITIVDPNVSSGTYTGGGTIARVSQIDISTKQYNFYLNQGRNVNVKKVDFLVDRTDKGQITIDIYPSSGLDAVQSLVLDTTPYALYPYEAYQDRLWHPIYTTAEGNNIQLNIYLADNNDLALSQIRQPNIAFSDFEMHAMMFYCTPTSSRLQ